MVQSDSAPASRSARRARRSVAGLLLAGLAAAAGAAAPAADPLAGKWLGTCGSERERIAFGVEIRATGDGTTTLLFHPARDELLRRRSPRPGRARGKSDPRGRPPSRPRAARRRPRGFLPGSAQPRAARAGRRVAGRSRATAGADRPRSPLADAALGADLRLARRRRRRRLRRDLRRRDERHRHPRRQAALGVRRRAPDLRRGRGRGRRALLRRGRRLALQAPHAPTARRSGATTWATAARRASCPTRRSSNGTGKARRRRSPTASSTSAPATAASTPSMRRRANGAGATPPAVVIRNGAAVDGARVVFGSADHFVYALDRASRAGRSGSSTPGRGRPRRPLVSRRAKC